MYTATTPAGQHFQAESQFFTIQTDPISQQITYMHNYINHQSFWQFKLLIFFQKKLRVNIVVS